jgi:hypothetical protein
MPIYYHGSHTPLDVGFVLRGRGKAYEADWWMAPFHPALNFYKPAGMIRHMDAVFMVARPEEVKTAAGQTEWLFELEPSGVVERHDMYWPLELTKLVVKGHGLFSPAVKDAALSYWNGDLHPSGDGLWEYLATEARIVSVEPIASCVVTP